jgi:hypothetical protein
MFLSRIAVVELQLILQCCDTSSRLRLARCSRWTLRVADTAVVWRGAPTMIEVSLDDEAGCARLRFSSSSLRHADVHLLARWVAPPLPPVPPLMPPVEDQKSVMFDEAEFRARQLCTFASLSVAVGAQLVTLDVSVGERIVTLVLTQLEHFDTFTKLCPPSHLGGDHGTEWRIHNKFVAAASVYYAVKPGNLCRLVIDCMHTGRGAPSYDALSSMALYIVGPCAYVWQDSCQSWRRSAGRSSADASAASSKGAAGL